MSTQKFETFINELKELCQKHQLQIATGEYDPIQIWPLKTGEPELWASGVEDHTE